MQHYTAEQQRQRTRELIAPGREPGDAPVDEWAALTTLLILQGFPIGQASQEATARLARRAQLRRALLLGAMLALLVLILI